MSKKVDNWMPLLVDKYLGDTTHLTTEQHGAYLLLLLAMWKQDGRLLNKEAHLAAICRMTPAKWKANRETLLPFFSADGDYLTQKRLSQELERAKAHNEAKAKAGAKGAAKRWQSDGTTNSTAMAEPIANGKQTPWQTDAPIPTPIPSPSENESASALSARARTPAGEATRAMRQAGLADANPSHPKLIALLDAHVTVEELTDAARTAVENGKGFAYALATAEGRRRDAAKVGSLPGKQSSEDWTAGAI